MGGEDWQRWIDALADAGVLAPGFRTLNYTYIGSELTWPIYWNGTLGRAKVDLDRKAEAIRSRLGEDAARVVALKAVVTQASSAIPVVPLYGTVLFKVMKQLGLHEGCIEQIDRLFRTRLGKDVEARRRQAHPRRRLGAVAKSSDGSHAAMAAAHHRNARRTGRPSGSTRASFCACSDSASTASTTLRMSTPASLPERFQKLSYCAWGCFADFNSGPGARSRRAGKGVAVPTISRRPARDLRRIVEVDYRAASRD